MSEEEQAKVDLKSFIHYFKNFHIFLAISYLVLGFGVHYIFGPVFSGIFASLYPILAYIYFIWDSQGHSIGKNQNRKFAIIVLMATVLFVIGIFALGLQEDRLILKSSAIHLEGTYGLTLNESDIASVSLVERLPQIKYKSNGFAIGGIRKGFFVTREREKVRLIINEKEAPFLLLETKTGEKIYYAGKDQAEEDLLQKMKQDLPQIEYR